MMTPEEQEKMDGSPARVRAVRIGNDDTCDDSYASHHQHYIDIKFQLGPRGEVGVNGCCIREVIQVVVDRLEGFQQGQFKCRENALAITKLQEAQHWLVHRTEERVRRRVKGFNKP
jgi:hypothetical protein